MYGLEYADEHAIMEAKKAFARVYPEFRAYPIGISQDKRSIIMECEFPDGTFWFKVDEYTVSHAYNSKDAADRDY